MVNQAQKIAQHLRRASEAAPGVHVQDKNLHAQPEKFMSIISMGHSDAFLIGSVHKVKN